MFRRNWQDLSRKLVDRVDLLASFDGVQAYQGEQALAFFGEGVVLTKLYPNPFVIGMSNVNLTGSVGNGIGFDPNGQITRIDTASTTSKTFTMLPADPSNARWDLLVIRYKATGDTLIPKPSDPIVSVYLNLHDDFELAVVAGTPSGSPAYPAKGPNDIILAGLQLAAGGTVGTTDVIVDLTVREWAQANQFALPVFRQGVPLGTIDGSNNVFTLPSTPLVGSSVLITIDSLKLQPGEYSVAGQIVTLAAPPVVGQSIAYFYVENGTGSVNPVSAIDDHLGVGNGAQTNYSLSFVPIDQQSTLVFANGLLVPKNEWSLIVSGDTAVISFATAPDIGTSVDAFGFLNLMGTGLGGGGAGDVQGAENVGASGVGIFKTLTAGLLQFKKLIAGSNVTIVDNLDGTVTISASGGGGGGGGGALVAYGTFLSPQVVVPAAGIASTTDARAVRFLKGQVGGGEQFVTANPQIAPGTTVGQELILKGCNDTDYPALQDGNGVSLNGVIKLKQNASIYLLWNGILWDEISRR